LLKLSIILIFFILSSIAFSADDELKVGDQSPKFTLKNADDKEYSLEVLLKKDKATRKVLILIMGDHTTRDSGNKWAMELHKVHGKDERVKASMIADLRGLPFYVTERMVKWGVKREKTPILILLDWHGKVNQLYKTERGKPNIFIIGDQGKILYIYKGEYSAKVFNIIKAKIQDCLKEN